MHKMYMYSLINNCKDKSYIYHPDEETETTPKRYKLALLGFFLFILKNLRCKEK